MIVRRAQGSVSCQPTKNHRVGWNGKSGSSLIEESLRAGLAVLWRAYIWAEHTGANVWDFAVGTDSLYQTGMTAADLRWLITKGLAEHRQETSALRGSSSFVQP